MWRDTYYGGVEMLDNSHSAFKLKECLQQKSKIHANCKFDKTLVQFQPPPLLKLRLKVYYIALLNENLK